MGLDIIGMFVDSHRTDAGWTDRKVKWPASGPRFNSEAEADIEAACTGLSDCGCLVQLGDFIAPHSDNYDPNENTHNNGTEGEVVLAAAVADIETYTGPIYHVIGNWDMYDFDFQTSADWFQHIRNGTRSPETIIEISATIYNDKDANAKAARYYMFQCPNGTIGLVIDTTGRLPDASPDEFQNEDTTKSASTTLFVPATQRDWIAATLASHEDNPIIVFCHMWVWPVIATYYNVNNAAAVRALFETYNANMIAGGKAGRVVAVVQAHHHPGGQGWWQDTDGQNPETYRTAASPFCVEHNKIKYLHLRSQICGWGANPGGATDDGGGGEATPANAYYKLIVGDFVKDKWDIRVVGHGANPGGENLEPQRYLVA